MNIYEITIEDFINWLFLAQDTRAAGQHTWQPPQRQSGHHRPAPDPGYALVVGGARRQRCRRPQHRGAESSAGLWGTVLIQRRRGFFFQISYVPEATLKRYRYVSKEMEYIWKSFFVRIRHFSWLWKDETKLLDILPSVIVSHPLPHFRIYVDSCWPHYSSHVIIVCRKPFKDPKS